MGKAPIPGCLSNNRVALHQKELIAKIMEVDIEDIKVLKFQYSHKHGEKGRIFVDAKSISP